MSNSSSAKYILKTVEGHKSVPISWKQVVCDNKHPEVATQANGKHTEKICEIQKLFCDIIEEQVRHYSQISWDASNLLSMFILCLLDVDQNAMTQIPVVNFNSTFFTRLLSACENEGAMFRKDACQDFKEFDDYFKECIKIFRLLYQERLGANNPMPARNNLKCKGITQIKHYIANQMVQNFDELYDRNMKKHYKPEPTSDSESDDDDEEYEEYDDGKYKVDRDGLLFLFNKLNEILKNNAVKDAKQERLIHLSPFFKCCTHYIHMDSKVIIETIRKNIGAKTQADMFSHRVHKYNKQVLKKMRKDIEKQVPEDVKNALYQTIFGSNFSIDHVTHMSYSELFNATADNTKTRISQNIYGCTLKPDYNKFCFSLQTNGVGCTLCWNWTFQYPVLNPDYDKPIKSKKRKRGPNKPKIHDVFEGFSSTSPNANEPYWKPGKASVSANMSRYKPADYDVVLFIDPGKVFFLYGARFEHPSDERLRGLLDDCDSNVPYVKQHVKYWLRTGGTRIPFKTHPYAIKWLQPISRNVGSFQKFMDEVFPQLYDRTKYSRIWCGPKALAFKKIYRRGLMERNSKRQHKREMIWRHEVTGFKNDAKVLVVVGNAYLNWKNTSTKHGSAPGKSLFKFLKDKGADIIQVDEFYTSQTCAICDVHFGKKTPQHFHNLRSSDKEEVEMYFNEATQKVEIECEDMKCRLQICKNQHCKRPFDSHGNKSFARDENSSLCIMKCFLYSYFKQDNCARHPAYCMTMLKEYTWRQKISSALKKKHEEEEVKKKQKLEENQNLLKPTEQHVVIEAELEILIKAGVPVFNKISGIN